MKNLSNNTNPYSNIVHRMYVYCTCVKTYLHVELYLKGRITRYKPNSVDIDEGVSDTLVYVTYTRRLGDNYE